MPLTFFTRVKKVSKETTPRFAAPAGYPSPLGSPGLRVNSHDPHWARPRARTYASDTPCPACATRRRTGENGLVCTLRTIVVFSARVAYATRAYKEASHMARHRELRGITHGLLGSFNSRNNDIDGYWGIGVLCLFAQGENISEIRIDLIHQEAPEASPICSSATQFRKMLDHLLAIRDLPRTWVKSAEFTVCFNVSFEHKFHFFGSALGGKPYMCTLEIVDDLGHKYSARAGGNCWPHNPMKERRSPPG
jgi:hypothetical protein